MATTFYPSSKSRRSSAASLASSGVRALAILGLVGSLTASARAEAPFDADIKNNSLAVSPDERLAAVSYSDERRVVVYDLQTGKPVKTLGGYVTPRNIVFAPDGKRFYVSDSSLGTVNVVDATSFETLARYPVGYGVFGTVLTADGKTLYANDEAASTVTAVDTTDGSAKAVIPGFSQPRQGIRLSPDGTQAFVTNFLGDKITVVDLATHKPTGEITGFKALRAISISKDGLTLYAGNSGADEVAVVDLAKREIVARVPVGKDPYGAALTPDGRFVYSGNKADNSLSVIDTGTRKVVATITGFQEPRQAIVFTKDGKTAYVLNKDLSIAVVDTAAHQIVKTLTPEGIQTR